MNPTGYCQCGCGEKTNISKRTRHDRGDVKGEPVGCLRGHTQSRGCHYSRRESHYLYRGDRLINDRGYVLLYRPTRPNCTRGGYVKEHRLVVEEILGRYLKPNELVHHNDKDRTNNYSLNLILFEAGGDHIRFHQSGKLRGLIHAFV